MQNQVLSIEQMQELIELGVDTSKASAFYYPNYGEYYEHPITKKYVHDIQSYNPYPSFVNGDRTLKDLNPDLFPTFTLQDILKILPEFLPPNIDVMDYTYELAIRKNSIYYDCEEFDYSPKGDLVRFEGMSIIENAFNMLKWCKQNNYC